MASTVVGISKPQRLEQTLHAAATTLPEEFWAQAADLVPPPEVWLDASPA